MALDLDDAQHWKHASSKLAEYAWILDNALADVGFEGDLLDGMVLSWWQMAMANAFASRPDFERMIEKIIGDISDDDDD